MGLLSAALVWSWTSLYAKHQINLRLRVSVSETTPTLRWTGKVGDVSAFRVWGSRAFVRDLSADKLSSRAVLCVFLGFPPNAPGWQFYHPTSCRVLSFEDVTFDESVPYYRLFPYRTAPLKSPPLFLAPGPPPVDPLPPQGPALSGVSQVDAVEPVEVAVDSSAARGAEPAGAGSGSVEPEPAEPGGAEFGGAEPGVAESGGAESEGAEPLCVESGDAARGGPSGAYRAAGAGGATGAGGPAAAGAAGGSGATGPGGARTGGTRAAGPGGAAGAGAAGGAGAGGTTGLGATRGAGGAAGASSGPGGAVARGAGAGGADGAGALGGAGVGATGAAGGAGGAGGATGVGADAEGAGGVTAEPAPPLPAPSPYTGPIGGLTERREPESRPTSPVRAARTGRRRSRQRPPPVPGTHQMALRPSTAPQRVPLLSPLASSLPALADPESDSLRAASPTVTHLLATVVTEPSFESTAASSLVAELVDFAAYCRLDYAASLVAESAPVCPPSVGGECALRTDVIEDRQEDF
ncbi:unnamed protein product [Closterium sp. NIES-53]